MNSALFTHESDGSALPRELNSSRIWVAASLIWGMSAQMSDGSSDQTTPLPEELDIERARAIIDTVIITMKPEEFAAILRRFPPIFQSFGELQYNIASVIDAQGQQRFIAIVR